MKKTSILLFIIGLFAASGASAQLLPGANQNLDKIVAVVGAEIIMNSDLNSALLMLKQQQPALDISKPELRKQVLDNMINEKLIITKAIEDSIKVTDEEVEQRWGALLQNMVRRFGSEKRVEEVYGMSISRIKFDFRDEIRKQILGAKLRQQRIADVTVAPDEVRNFYNEYKDSIGQIPEQVEFYHIMKYALPDKRKKEEVLAFARKVRDSLIAGGDFTAFAKRYSEDPGSKNDGGDIGWVSKGKLFAEFEKAAYALADNEISQPVETPFGYHIIQTLEKRAGEVHARHILFRIGESDSDLERVKRELDSLRQLAMAGADFEELARMNSEDKETRGFGGLLGRMTMDELPPQLKTMTQNMKDGDVTEPLTYTKDPLKKGYHIIQKKRNIPAHAPTIEEDYKIIEQYALAIKQNKLLMEWINQLRAEMYWEIKEL